MAILRNQQIAEVCEPAKRWGEHDGTYCLEDPIALSQQHFGKGCMTAIGFALKRKINSAGRLLFGEAEPCYINKLPRMNVNRGR